MAVDELDRIAGLPARVLLRERHDVFGCVRRENHVISELHKELIRKRKESVEHEAARDTHGLLCRVALTAVILKEKLLGARIERTVQGDLLLACFVRLARRTSQVKAFEGRSLKAGAGGGFRRHERRAHGTRDRKMRAHGYGVAPKRAERLDNGRVVRHAALKHDVLAHGLRAHNAMQVVAHDGKREARGHVGLARTCGQRGVDGRLDEDGATLAEVHGRRGREREGTVIRDCDAEACRLFLNKGACSRRADLVHLEIDDLPVTQRDVLGVLPADFEDSVYLRVCVRGAGRLARDLVYSGIGAHELGHKAAARAGGDHGIHGHHVAQAPTQRGQPLAYGVARVARGPQVLRVEHAARAVEQHEIRRGRARVDTERRMDQAILGGLPLGALHVNKALARHITAVRQRRRTGKHVDSDGAARLAQRSEKPLEADALLAAAGMQRRAGSLRKQRLVPTEQLVFSQAEHVTHRAHDARVKRDTASKRHRRLNGKAAHDECLETLGHGIAEAQKNVLDGHALLLPVNDVRLGKNRAAARDSRHRLRARHQVGIVLDRKAKARHLVLEEGPRARGAALVHGELRHLARADPVDVAGVLSAHGNDGARVRRERGHTTGDGGHVLQNRKALGAHGDGNGARR